jgi:4'-phosphopantetheinyl transferase
MAEISNIPWPMPPAGFSLGAHDVHVWTAALVLPPERVAMHEASLSSDEHARAARFLFARDRRRFVAGRGILRAILGCYLQRPPAQIRFNYNPRGKPSLAGLSSQEQIHFNLAHSDDLAVFAVSRIAGIGIDLEMLRAMNDAEAIAERFFSTHESKLLKSLPSSQKQAGFFNLWTRKEAWLKAAGEGIGELLNQVEVSLRPGEPARLLSISNDAKAASKWSLRELAPAPGYVGALAVPSTDFQMHCWSWREQTVRLPSPALSFAPEPGLTLTNHYDASKLTGQHNNTL